MSEKGQHKWRIFVVSLVLSLVALGICYIFGSLKYTVLGDVLPSLTNTTFFSIMSILAIVILIFSIDYFYRHYYSFTFAEMNTNRMYTLIKMGTNIHHLITLRIISAIIMPLTLYLASFIWCFLLSILLGFRLEFNAFLGLFLVATILLVGIVVLILTISLFVKQKKYALPLFVIVLLAMAAYSIFGGFLTVSTYSPNIAQLSILFGSKTSYFLPVVLSLIVVLLAICALKAEKDICYYKINHAVADGMVVIDFEKNVPIKPFISEKTKTKVYNISLLSFFGLMALSALVSNIYLMIMSTKSLSNVSGNNQEVALLFDSVTMEEDIHKNDFVVFNTLTPESEIKTGDIVYYINDLYKPIVAKVQYITINAEGDAYYMTDINTYPSGTAVGSLRVELPRERIKGVVTYNSRGLGVWFVFNQSLGGKIVMIVLPLFVIVFFDKLVYLSKTYNQTDEENLPLN